MGLDRNQHISQEKFFNARVAVGKTQQRTPVSVTATAQEVILTAGATTVEIHNSGDKVIYFGGSDVASTTGIPIFQDEGKIFSNVKPNWSIWVRCAAGQTSTLRVVDYQ